jgi:hypothetical protein
MAPRQIEVPSDEDMPELTISLEKVCFVIIKAREFDCGLLPTGSWKRALWPSSVPARHLPESAAEADGS